MIEINSITALVPVAVDNFLFYADYQNRQLYTVAHYQMLVPADHEVTERFFSHQESQMKPTLSIQDMTAKYEEVARVVQERKQQLIEKANDGRTKRSIPQP